MFVCVAMFATAQYGEISTLRQQLEELDQFTTEIDALRHQSEGPHATGAFMHHYCVPDNRFQLNLIRLAAIRTGRLNQFNDLCGQLPTRDIELLPWTAFANHFDFPRLPVDTRADTQTFTFVHWGKSILSNQDYEAQRKLVKAARELLK
jgi:hypothetical protein